MASSSGKHNASGGQRWTKDTLDAITGLINTGLPERLASLGTGTNKDLKTFEVTFVDIANMVAMFMMAPKPPQDPNVRRACEEFSAMVQLFESEFPELAGTFFPCVTSPNDSHFVLVMGDIATWTKSKDYVRVLERNDTKLPRILRSIASAVIAGDLAMGRMEISSVYPQVALMFFDKLALSWVAHRYGICLQKSPLKMMRMVRSMHRDSEKYGKNLDWVHDGFDHSFPLKGDEMVVKTMRKDECDYCGRAAPKLFKCGGCGCNNYCSKECQSAQWKDHKAKCAERKAAGVKEGVTDYFAFADAFHGRAARQGPVKVFAVSQP